MLLSGGHRVEFRAEFSSNFVGNGLCKGAAAVTLLKDTVEEHEQRRGTAWYTIWVMVRLMAAYLKGRDGCVHGSWCCGVDTASLLGFAQRGSVTHATYHLYEAISYFKSHYPPNTTPRGIPMPPFGYTRRRGLPMPFKGT